MRRQIVIIFFLIVGAALLQPGLAAAQAPDFSAQAVQKAKDDLAAAEQTVAIAKAAKVVAEKALVQAATAQAAGAKDAAAKELAVKKAALKVAQAKVAAARQTLLAEQAWAARLDVTKALTAKRLADRDFSVATAAAADAAAKGAKAQKAADKAAADKAAAEKAFKGAPKDKKAEAKKALEQKAAAARKAAAEAAQAKQAAQKAAAKKAAAEKVVAEKDALVTQAHDAAALAHAAALGGLPPISRGQWDYAKARHLLFRAGFGGPPEEVERLVKMGPYQAVDYLVDYYKQPPANIEIDIKTWDRPLAYEERLHVQARDKLAERRMNRDLTQRSNMRRWWLKRMLESPRPLEEKLVLFWHDHFATSWLEIRDSFMMYQQNQLFRRYADRFDALLHGIVQDPAMIRYLNNDENIKGNHNENLGREVLELFSMGEENSANHKKDGYTEKDVRDGMTRALTGYTFDKWTGQFRYNATRHDTGEKVLLGQKGNWGPHEAMDIVLKHPATARYIVKKLWQYFAYWEPEPEVIDKLAQVLRENHYDLRPVLKSLFLSQQFYGSKSLANHIKGPSELLVGTAKIFKMTNVDPRAVDLACMNMRQIFLEPPSVAGWPEGRDWINANLILVRYNSAAKMVQDNKVDFVALLQGRRLNSSAEVVDHMVQRCLLAPLKEEKRQALIQFLGELPPPAEWAKQRDPVNAKLRALAVMLMSMPEYQVN